MRYRLKMLFDFQVVLKAMKKNPEEFHIQMVKLVYFVAWGL